MKADDIAELLSKAESLASDMDNQDTDDTSNDTQQQQPPSNKYEVLKKTAAFLKENPFPKDQEIEDFVKTVQLDRSQFERLLFDILSFFLKSGMDSLIQYLDTMSAEAEKEKSMQNGNGNSDQNANARNGDDNGGNQTMNQPVTPGA